jgi:hypothetical protein
MMLPSFKKKPRTLLLLNEEARPRLVASGDLTERLGFLLKKRQLASLVQPCVSYTLYRYLIANFAACFIMLSDLVPLLVFLL